MDVVVDGLMVVQQRRDPNSGSEDLQTFSWAMVGFGGVVGSLAGGYLTEYGLEKWCFGAKGCIGFLIMVVACKMSKEIEKDPDELVTCSLLTRTKSNAKDVWKGIKLPELYKSVGYFMLMGIFIPSFSSFLYYYEIVITGFT